MARSSRWLARAAAAGVLLLAVVPWAPAGAADAPAPTPRATCGPGSRLEPDTQGRAPDEDPSRTEGYRCNLELLSRFGDFAGYKVHRYVDATGNECAYYDSTLLFPGSALNGTNLTGVHVLDMSDPANPVKTANLVTPAMESPHESLELNQARGLLAAGMGYPTFNPGFVDIYDVTQDCRQPGLLSSTPLGVLGHESGFAPDGNTFYVSSTGGGTLTALDVSDPAVPEILWISRDYSAHGMRISDDGNRLYIADTSDGLIIVDVSEIQARAPNATGREISRLTWDVMTIPQVAIPVTIQGRPYIVEIDEFSDGTSTAPDAPVGAARIIDISDETQPRVVSDIRLEVNNPEHRAAATGDSGTGSGLQGYTGHYCSVPQRDEPGIVACSFVASGLRVFDIRDPLQPKEIAYWNQPVANNPIQPTEGPSSYAMSAPTFVPERAEIWYADGNSGFWALRFTNGVWPFEAAAAPPAQVPPTQPTATPTQQPSSQPTSTPTPTQQPSSQPTSTPTSRATSGAGGSTAPSPVPSPTAPPPAVGAGALLPATGGSVVAVLGAVLALSTSLALHRIRGRRLPP